MLYVTIAMLILIIICQLAFHKNAIWSPVCIFSLLWIGIIVFYKSGYVELYPLSSRAELIIALGVFGFFVGGELSYSTIHRKYVFGKHGTYRNKQIDNHIDIGGHIDRPRNNLIFALSVACIVMLIIRVIPSIALIRMGYTFEQITEGRLYYKAEGGLMLLFSVYFMYPFSSVLPVIGAYEMMKGKKGDKRIILCSIIVVILSALQRGGRFVTITYFVYILTYKNLLGKKINIKPRTKRIIAIITIAAVIAVLKLSESRGTSSITQSAIMYMCGCLPNMDQRLFTGGTNPLTFGGSSLYGYIAPVMYLLKGFGMPYPDFFMRLTNAVNVENVISIGPSNRYNAFVTLFYHMFLDGREFGVIVGSVLLELISMKAYKKARNNISEKDAIIYGLLMYQIISPMIRVQFSGYTYALSFLYIPLLYRLVREET